MKVTISLLILTISFAGCNRNERDLSEKGGKMLTKKEIIDIASKVFESQEFPLEGTDIYYDLENKEWQKVLIDLSRDDPDFAERYKRKLKHKSYQAVRYRPDMTRVMSGDFWVFIDKKTGKLITFCGGL